VLATSQEVICIKTWGVQTAKNEVAGNIWQALIHGGGVFFMTPWSGGAG
jgi:hypothetical protein